MNIFSRIKLRRQREQGLFMILDGLKIQYDQAVWHLEASDLSETMRNYWGARKHVVEYWMKEAQSAVDGKLHF